MDQEIPLPPPRTIRTRSPAKKASDLRAVSSRPSRLSVSSFPSSDPAFFSSDDIPSSSLENYNNNKNAEKPANSKKRRYRGTWWGEKAIGAKRKRADFREKRHLDSGVWMGSDGSSSECLLSSEASSCDDFLALGQDAKKVSVVEDNMKDDDDDAKEAENGRDTGPTFAARNLQKQDEPKEHQTARALVNDCLEKGQDCVDLR